MVKHLNVAVDDETYERLREEKKRRNLTWDEFLDEVSYEVTEE